VVHFKDITIIMLPVDAKNFSTVSYLFIFLFKKLLILLKKEDAWEMKTTLKIKKIAKKIVKLTKKLYMKSQVNNGLFEK
jgi:hypothetical protein